MCSCDIQFAIEVEGRTTCSFCGSITTQHFVTRFDGPRDSLNVATYERRKRFRDIMTRLLFPSIENKDFPMYSYLKNQNTQIETVADLLCCMKRSKLPDKRYISLHAFARRFLHGYKPPVCANPHTLIKLYTREFDVVEIAHARKSNVPNFFNYAWLLRKLLCIQNRDDLKQFVKPIKCPKRNEYYTKLFKSLDCDFTDIRVC